MDTTYYVQLMAGDLLVQIASLREALDQQAAEIEALKKQIFELTKEG